MQLHYSKLTFLWLNFYRFFSLFRRHFLDFAKLLLNSQTSAYPSCSLSRSSFTRKILSVFPGRYAYPSQRRSSNPYALHEYRNKSKTKNVTVARVSTSIPVSQISQRSKNSLRVFPSFIPPDDDSAIAVFSEWETLKCCELRLFHPLKILSTLSNCVSFPMTIL